MCDASSLALQRTSGMIFKDYVFGFGLYTWDAKKKKIPLKLPLNIFPGISWKKAFDKWVCLGKPNS